MLFYVEAEGYDNNELFTEKYLTYGETYVEAMDKIEKYCGGAKNIYCITTKPIGDEVSVVPDWFDPDAYNEHQIW